MSGCWCGSRTLYALLGFLRTYGVLDLPFSDVILPLGISFFTFTQIGYLVDVKQGVAKDRGLLNYILFVTFFPHLIAGPILHNREMMPQFADRSTYQISSRNFAVGTTIFVIGLLKKCVLADPLSATVQAGFGHPESLWVRCGLVLGAVLFVPALFRLFRLLGHGDRACPHVQRAVSSKLQLALQGDWDH